MSYKVADSTLKMMKAEEGFRGYAYPDGSENGVPKFSIGYGHQIQPGENFVQPISEALATDILKTDLEKRLPNLNKVLPGGLTQRQFDQLLSYSMSFGLQRILEAKLYKLIAQSAPAEEVKKWWLSSYVTVNGIPSNGLKGRRQRQVNAFFSDPYPADPTKSKTAAIIITFVALAIIFFLTINIIRS
jgi:GH24 family phage-related lysozyme (muramidase)